MTKTLKEGGRTIIVKMRSLFYNKKYCTALRDALALKLKLKEKQKRTAL